MGWRLSWGAAVLATLSLGVTAAGAAPLTFLYDIDASGFVPAFGHAAPIDPVHISFRLTFDPSASVPETGVGISLISSNLPVDGSLLFDYLIDGFGGDLFVGGSAGGLFSEPFGSNDFGLDLRDVTSATPTFNVMSYHVADVRDSFHTTTGTVTKTAVPEPAVWALTIMGFGLAGAGLRRRRIAAARAA